MLEDAHVPFSTKKGKWVPDLFISYSINISVRDIVESLKNDKWMAGCMFWW